MNKGERSLREEYEGKRGYSHYKEKEKKKRLEQRSYANNNDELYINEHIYEKNQRFKKNFLMF